MKYKLGPKKGPKRQLVSIYLCDSGDYRTFDELFYRGKKKRERQESALLFTEISEFLHKKTCCGQVSSKSSSLREEEHDDGKIADAVEKKRKDNRDRR